MNDNYRLNFRNGNAACKRPPVEIFGNIETTFLSDWIIEVLLFVKKVTQDQRYSGGYNNSIILYFTLDESKFVEDNDERIGDKNWFKHVFNQVVEQYKRSSHVKIVVTLLNKPRLQNESRDHSAATTTKTPPTVVYLLTPFGDNFTLVINTLTIGNVFHLPMDFKKRHFDRAGSNDVIIIGPNSPGYWFQRFLKRSSDADFELAVAKYVNNRLANGYLMSSEEFTASAGYHLFRYKKIVQHEEDKQQVDVDQHQIDLFKQMNLDAQTFFHTIQKFVDDCMPMCCFDDNKRSYEKIKLPFHVQQQFKYQRVYLTFYFDNLKSTTTAVQQSIFDDSLLFVALLTPGLAVNISKTFVPKQNCLCDKRRRVHYQLSGPESRQTGLLRIQDNLNLLCALFNLHCDDRKPGGGGLLSHVEVLLSIFLWLNMFFRYDVMEKKIDVVEHIGERCNNMFLGTVEQLLARDLKTLFDLSPFDYSFLFMKYIEKSKILTRDLIRYGPHTTMYGYVRNALFSLSEETTIFLHNNGGAEESFILNEYGNVLSSSLTIRQNFIDLFCSSLFFVGIPYAKDKFGNNKILFFNVLLDDFSLRDIYDLFDEEATSVRSLREHDGELPVGISPASSSPVADLNKIFFKKCFDCVCFWKKKRDQFNYNQEKRYIASKRILTNTSDDDDDDNDDVFRKTDVSSERLHETNVDLEREPHIDDIVEQQFNQEKKHNLKRENANTIVSIFTKNQSDVSLETVCTMYQTDWFIAAACSGLMNTRGNKPDDAHENLPQSIFDFVDGNGFFVAKTNDEQVPENDLKQVIEQVLTSYKKTNQSVAFEIIICFLIDYLESDANLKNCSTKTPTLWSLKFFRHVKKIYQSFF